MDFDIYLASQSPRRRELLEQIGVRYKLLDIAVAEDVLPGETPLALVQRLACSKAQAGWHSLLPEQRKPVLGADTIVIFADQVLGKPAVKQVGMEMLQMLSGHVHQVLTAVALVNETSSVMVNRSEVKFRSLTLPECEAYWDKARPSDKAGAYGIQGLAAAFIEHLSGSYSGVMGLPLYETAQLLAQANIHVLK